MTQSSPELQKALIQIAMMQEYLSDHNLFAHYQDWLLVNAKRLLEEWDNADRPGCGTISKEDDQR